MGPRAPTPQRLLSQCAILPLQSLYQPIQQSELFRGSSEIQERGSQRCQVFLKLGLRSKAFHSQAQSRLKKRRQKVHMFLHHQELEFQHLKSFALHSIYLIVNLRNSKLAASTTHPTPSFVCHILLIHTKADRRCSALITCLKEHFQMLVYVCLHLLSSNSSILALCQVSLSNSESFRFFLFPQI